MANRLMCNFLARRHIRRLFRGGTNPLDLYDDVDLMSRFHFHRADIIDQCDIIVDSIDYPLSKAVSHQ